MPIAVEVVPPAQFAAWVSSKGGSMPGTAPAETEFTPTAGDNGTEATQQVSEVDATVTPPVVDQSATAN